MDDETDETDETDEVDTGPTCLRLSANELRQKVGYVFMSILMVLILFICLVSFNVIL